MKWLYLAINAGTVVVPFIFSYRPKLAFYKNFKSFFSAAGIAAFIFVIWDVLFTKIGVWGFNPDYVTGIYFLNLPLEEILFFFCIPFSCVFTYHCLTLFFSLQWEPVKLKTFTLLLSLIFIMIGFANIQKWYTSVTFLSLAALLLLIQFYVKAEWLGKLFTVYPVLLIPFFVVNGILTGSGIANPVVWYNNDENLGIRLLTIPVEDVFYGFELILLTLFFYELFRGKQSRSAAGL